MSGDAVQRPPPPLAGGGRGRGLKASLPPERSAPSPNPLPQGEGENYYYSSAMTDAELRALLIDCLALWDVRGRVAANDSGVSISTDDGNYLLQRATPDMRPTRWLLQTPARRTANRPPRAAPSIVALLAALRNALGAEGGNRLRIGMGAPTS
jgi:hypothetical protein